MQSHFSARVSPGEAGSGTEALRAAHHASREADRLHHLSVDDAEFVEAAFERIIPELGGSETSGAAASFVDRKLDALAHADPHAGRAPVEPTWRARQYRGAPAYRSGIAAVQSYCLTTHGRRFQHLPVWSQLEVLSVLEDHGESAMDPYAHFFHILVNDAAESFFDSGR